MLKFIADLTNVGTGVYILWGIAFLALLMKIVSNSYVKGLMKKSENMATTRKKCLRTMRQKYENRINLGMEGSSKDFVEKNIRNVRLLGVPIEAAGQRLNLGVLTTIMVTAGAFLFYDNKWRGSPQMVTFLANSIIVCAFLMSLENIFLTRNKLEILKANIRDYLDNMTERRQAVPVRPVMGGALVGGACEKPKPTEVRDSKDAEASQLATVQSAATTEEQDDALNSFLKEFFH